MDSIADSIYTDVPAPEELNDNPSLLTVIFELTPRSWYALRNQVTIQETVKTLLVFLNAHLSLNNSNQVCFILSSPFGSDILHPNVESSLEEQHEDGASDKPTLVNKGMYRNFRLVDEIVMQKINSALEKMSSQLDSEANQRSTVAGALSRALTYTNRLLHVDQSISTTTGSAINSTASTMGSSGTTSTSGNPSTTSMHARVLIVTPNDTYESNYIAIMNSIFAAQKMKVPLDVAKLGGHQAPYLQQAADATNGVYLHIKEPQGLMQVLSTAYFLEPSLRSIVILPTNSNVNYKASCFITGKPVDIGFVCSVCLCIMSVVPKSGHCPTCQSKFDERFLERLIRGPVIARKKRKVENGSGTPAANGDTSKTPEVGTPAPKDQE
ncbi:hypothetical protein FT663_00997 [Candidozyma haemuli var. vulneris]|uniref:General transcription and DNA repair factor IIH subunit TFB4 n=1 Tax=Candidozyma haemuli TaxID=45357 RepID=A0A2V1AV95_9ASCO|nr:hypothetical protein CXQ85_000759 [[Candida] haemuloni]KAF3991686.1 hypothetical protein FT662_01568 [[Candida] haemuloni var. vulneris]KAF3994892.1 hypothetical protein FT663_00997 [[Candida] haemuloni var. vulneris]PVH21768.1 hypothetical protein CXQ85_000759 [[Candida] haemuloni]